jgi:hypothetical protein
MLDPEYHHAVLSIVDAVDDAVGTPARGMPTRQLTPKLLADALRIVQ